MDYCNSLLNGLPDYYLNRLQKNVLGNCSRGIVRGGGMSNLLPYFYISCHCQILDTSIQHPPLSSFAKFDTPMVIYI